MRKALFTGITLAAALLLLVPAGAAKRSGIEGVVLNATCAASPCPQPAASRYQGSVTVQVRRVRDAELVATRTISDGTFRIRLRRGHYDVSATAPGTDCPPNAICCPPNAPCACPSEVCIAQQAAVIAPCTSSDSRRVRVRRHKFTRVELQLQSTCIAQPQQ